MLDHACLRDNPFTPSIADSRKGNEIILKGTPHQGISQQISTYISKLAPTDKKVIVLLGRVGTGKTAIIKRALYGALAIQEISLGQIKTIQYNNSNILLGYLAPSIQNEKTDKLLIEVVKIILQNTLTEQEFKNISKTNDLIKLRKILVEKLIEKNYKGLIIIIDQFERIERPINSAVFTGFIRELSNELSTRCGFLLVLSTIPREDVQESLRYIEKYLGVHTYSVSLLKKIEAKKVLQELIKYYRLTTEECIKKSQQAPYYPFTDEAVDYVLSLIEAKTMIGGTGETFIAEQGISPRTMYTVFDRILEEAVRRGEIPITKDVVDYILGLAPDISYIINWHRYLLSSTTLLSSESVANALEYMLNYMNRKRMPVDGFIVKVVTNINKLLSLIKRSNLGSLTQNLLPFKPKANVKIDKVIDLARLFDLLVYFESTDGRGKIYLIRTRRIGPTTIHRLVEFFDSIQSISIKGKEFRITENIVLQIINVGPSSSYLQIYAEYLNTVLVITVDQPIVIDYQADPLTYGALLYISDIASRYEPFVEKSEVEYTIRYLASRIFRLSPQV